VAIATDCLHRIRHDLESVGPGIEKAPAVAPARTFEVA
jgi:hypothetical protein